MSNKYYCFEGELNGTSCQNQCQTCKEYQDFDGPNYTGMITTVSIGFALFVLLAFAFYYLEKLLIQLGVGFRLSNDIAVLAFWACLIALAVWILYNLINHFK